MLATPTRSPGRALLKTPSKEVPVNYAPPLPTTVFANDAALKASLNTDLSSLDFALRTLLTAKTERKRLHEAVLSELVEEGRRLEREAQKLSEVQSQLEATLARERQEVGKANEVVKSLEGRKRALGEQLAALEADMAEWQAKVDAARQGEYAASLWPR
jgi:chromosome segregation ATPase